ncbi:MAG: NAD-dependent epimerase/dehydratase family protein [Acidimicrobiales bacterium]|nr:NAD-dependent epimerase/dehydratase family protein [Acidimicrobiales bacterium]
MTEARDSVSRNIVGEDLASMTERLDAVFSKISGDDLLITGGAGFLGYYMVQAPLAWNAANPGLDPVRVTVHDNFLRGVPDWLSNLDDPNLRIVTRSVLDPMPADEPRFDWIIHAASVASPIFYRKYPIETMDANVDGLRMILDSLEERADSDHPVKGFAFFSTSEIYGDPHPDFIPTDETYRGRVSCTGPRACYDESKRYGETLCVNFAQQYNLPIGIIRPFNNYGPGLRIDDGRVLPDFARDVLNGRDIVMLSDGGATRTFCYVADAVTGYYLILGHSADYPGESFNIGTDQPEISVRELADRVTEMGRRLWGYDGKVVVKTSDDPEYLTDNPNRRCPIIDKARSMLGYEPLVGIDEGLERAMLWYEQQDER